MRGGSFSDGTIIIGTNVDTAGINSGLQRINKTIKRFIGVTALIQFGKAAIKAASDLQEVQNIVDVTFGDLEDKMERFASVSIEAYGLSEFMAKSIAGSFMAMGKASGIAADDAANMALQLTALAGDMASFYNISQEYARVALSAVYTGETETLKRYGIILTEANLQEYAHTLGIETKVKAMDASTKAMLRYQYILEQTQHIQGDFIRTQGNWANQFRVLQERWRQFLITIGSGLITIGTPILKTLNAILQAVTAWANAIGTVIAKLLGIEWQDFTAEMGQLSNATVDAGESEEDLADGIGKATKAAKKALMPFDELNVLTRKTADNASGLATDLGLGVADFETAFDVDGKGFEIKPPDISSWYEFGKYISDTLGGLLDKIDWPTIQEHVKTFAHNFAELLNGFFQKENFEKLGHTIAEAFNTIVDYAFEFGTTFDFENFGKTLAAGVNKFFTDFDFKQFGAAINTWVKGLWTAIQTFFKGDENGEGGIDWPAVRNAIADFLSEIDIETVGLVIGYLFIKKVNKMALISFAAPIAKGLAKAIAEKLSIWLPTMMADINFKLLPAVMEAWGSLGGLSGLGSLTFSELFGAGTGLEIGMGLAAEIAEGIIAFFGGLRVGTLIGSDILGRVGMDDAYKPYMKLGGTITMLKDFGLAIKDFFKMGMIKDTGIYKFFVNLGDKISELWKNAQVWFGDISYAISHMFIDARDAVVGVWDTVVTWFTDNIITPIQEAFAAFGAWWSSFFAWWGSVFESIWIVVKAIWITVADWFNTNVIVPLKAFFESCYIVLTTTFNNIWETIKGIWGKVSDWFRSSVIDPLVAHFNAAKIFLQEIWSRLWEDIKSIWATVSSWFENTVINPIKATFDAAKIFLYTIWSNLWEDIKTLWTNASTWFDENVIQKISGLFSTLWDGVTKGVKDAMNFAIGIIEGFINKVIDAINLFTSGLSTIANAASLVTGDNYSAIASIQHVSLPRLATGAVIPPNREFAAILGDQKHGTNIEAPLDTIVQAFKMALSENDSNTMMALMQQQVELLGVISEKEFGISESQLFNSVKKSASRYTAATGQNAF